MNEFFAIMSTVNSTCFHGRQAGTVMLTEMQSDRKAVKLLFRFAPQGHAAKFIDKGGSSLTFQIHRAVDFKYKLRKLHREGNRNVTVNVREAT